MSERGRTPGGGGTGLDHRGEPRPNELTGTREDVHAAARERARGPLHEKLRTAPAVRLLRARDPGKLKSVANRTPAVALRYVIGGERESEQQVGRVRTKVHG
jgi:hypothetical protein